MGYPIIQSFYVLSDDTIILWVIWDSMGYLIILSFCGLSDNNVACQVSNAKTAAV